MTTPRSGFALLEVMVAMALMATAAVSLMGVLGAATRSLHAVRAKEAVAEHCHSAMTAYALMSTRDLARRIGAQQWQHCLVEISRPRPAIYRIAATPDSAAIPLLVTLLYRRVEAP
jgi:prepilin-type N-terminal cleavage/methylation domain-containing protein